MCQFHGYIVTPPTTMNFLGNTGTFALYATLKTYADYLEEGGLEEFDASLADKFPRIERAAILMTAYAIYHRKSGTDDLEILEELRTDCPDYVIIVSCFLRLLGK